jgi:MFS family permease
VKYLATVFANVGHLYTHMFTILYATAVLYLPQVFGLPYGELLTIASPGLILYGVAALPAGWLGDRWSQVGMLVVFFLGVGTGTLMTGLAQNTGMLFAGLTMLGLYA